MPKFLFWNIGGHQAASVVRDLAVATDADIIILAESKIDPAKIILALNENSSAYRFSPTVLCDRLQFFSKFDGSLFGPILYESDKTSLRRVSLPGRQQIILAATHLPSKINFSDASQSFEFVNLTDAIAEAETAEGHRRTILLGDFNVNPFEDGMVAARALNAVMSRTVALRGSRRVQGRDYPFFYNPMWAHFGDRPEAPGGTFYYEKAEHVTYFWNIFDQVLIRPDLAGSFRHDQVRILTSAGSTSLLRSDGRPDKTSLSDHLPVMLEIEF